MTLGPRIRLQRCHDGTFVIWQKEGEQYTDGRGHYARPRMVKDLPEYVGATLECVEPVGYTPAQRVTDSNYREDS